MATLLQNQYAAGITQCFTGFKVGLWCIIILHYWAKTSYGIIKTSLTFLWKNTSNHSMIWCSALINPLQQELCISTPAFNHALVVPTNIHQVSPSTCSSVSRRRWRWWVRSGRAPCASGGRSGREGGHSEGSSGDPPRRSAPSYSPEQHKGGTSGERNALTGYRIEENWSDFCSVLTSFPGTDRLDSNNYLQSVQRQHSDWVYFYMYKEIYTHY